MTEQATPVRAKKWFDRSKEGYTANERKDLRRSGVRVLVTYAAALYLFVLGPIAAWLVFGAATVSVDADGNTMQLLAPKHRRCEGPVPVNTSYRHRHRDLLVRRQGQ
ncbi:MAG: hypothetical protein OXK82_04655 [Deltaproteobacteria bacterium]|nr:hypothetical protein [Deltaproteobacteria bacterium]